MKLQRQWFQGEAQKSNRTCLKNTKGHMVKLHLYTCIFHQRAKNGHQDEPVDLMFLGHCTHFTWWLLKIMYIFIGWRMKNCHDCHVGDRRCYVLFTYPLFWRRCTSTPERCLAEWSSGCPNPRNSRTCNLQSVKDNMTQ